MIIHKNLRPSLNLLFAACLIFACYSCGSDSTTNNDKDKDATTTRTPEDFTVRILLRGNVDGLNVLLTQTASATEVLTPNVHCGLLDMDPKTFEYKPYLAKAQPEIKELDGGRMAISYEIREEAVWDDGSPITGEDYAFTIKAIKNPKTNAAPTRTFVEFIEAVEVDPNNLKKFTIICNKVYLLAKASTGTAPILPAYYYDAQGLMSDFTIAELNDPANLDRLNKDPRIVDFAKDFNENYNHDPEKIIGAGAYKVTDIVNNQHIKLVRKKDWWGDKVNDDFIAAYPNKLHFKIIEDDNNALLSLKEQELDVMTYIPADKFLELKKNDRAKKHFNFYTPDAFGYRYIGMNMTKPKLSDVRVRKALAHLVDKEHLVEQVSSGLATSVNGPVSHLKKSYNKNIPTIAFDIEKAKALLDEAGWKDTDGDNIRDKVVEGQKLSLSLKFLYPQGKQLYKDIGQVFKDEAARAGVEIVMISSEGSVMIEDLKKREFDLTCLGWSQSPLPDDFKQIWHTASNTYEGSNLVGFGNEESDQLIEEIRITMDEEKRNKMYLRFQEIIADQQPYIFLFSSKSCMAISKRFKNAEAVSLRPGYFARYFQLAEES
ncbi:ABC transporter substrate-binding protein [Aureispira sp. CCB-E]|uniref:ABC transporter substrate-binding protein n=1 Tax=Aureispira sp. CCB-E TaxID=3051121 RepID=UPI002868F6F3|nr:ABC transporter substrate-binding protein [Aureispira sp. CCB-E]WMX17208.1 ABC transporter substrate-binding protein [Aureispira sp. CCB-E]